MFANRIDWLTKYEELNLLLHLHLPPYQLNEHNCINRVNLLRKEALAQQEHFVKALEGQLGVVGEDLVGLDVG